MFKTLKNAWSIPELRQKLIFTLLILLLFRLGCNIPVPFINGETLSQMFDDQLAGTAFDIMNMMSGSALSEGTLLALGIQPYINASIIIQLLTIAIPALERMAKEQGEEGKKKINKITRYATVGLGLLMGYAYYMMLVSYNTSWQSTYGTTILSDTGFLPGLVIVLTFTAGSAVVMWLGEQINEFGIGNGISMILFANIISGIPSAVATVASMFTSSSYWWQGLIIVIGMLLLVLFIVFINDAERRIPIQYAKRVVGRKVYGGQSTNMPIKVAMSGVMPVIFAQSICTMPATIATFFGKATENNWWYVHVWSNTSWTYIVVYGLMIFFFSWFYSTIQYDPIEISNNLKKNGGFIPGFRPGRPTAEFIKRVISKIMIFGAVYLAIVALLPIIGGKFMTSVTSLGIGGTSVIIVVGVALETVKALEAQMLMRHYKGFLD